MPSQDHEKIIEALAEKYADMRDKRSIAQVADDLGIPKSTFYKLHSEYQEEILKRADKKREKYKGFLRSAAYNALENRLSKSDKAIELAFKVLNELVERTEVTQSFKTPEEKKQYANDLLKALSLKLNEKASPSSKLSETEGIQQQAANKPSDSK